MKRSTAIRGISGLFSLSVIAAATLAASTTASAAPQSTGKPTSSTLFVAPAAAGKIDPRMVARFNRAQVLDGIAGKITLGLSEGDRARIPGFTDIVVDADTNHLRLYWKGTPPQRVRDILAHLPAGVTADVVSARYSKADMHAARQRLLQNGKPVSLHVASSEAALRITSIALATDGSGLQVGYDEDLGVGKRSLTDPLATSARQARTSAVQALTTQRAGIPTTAELQPLGKDLSRESDSSPWYGGSAIKSSTAAICTTGFPVKHNGAFALTVAYHCVGSFEWFTFGAGVRIGVSGLPAPQLTAASYDTDLLYADSGAVGGQLFDGYPTEATYAKPLIGWQANNTGDPVCTDGANSGVHCAVTIQQTDTGITGPNGVYRPDVDLATANNSGISTPDVAAMDGDSGGPVFTLGNNSTADYARGTISMNKYQMTCPSKYTSQVSTYRALVTTAYCYGGTYYVPISQILSMENLTLVTD
jgi:hypothetical protein